MKNMFTVDDIKCEILPHGNQRMVSFPEKHYGIVADVDIDGKAFEYAEIYSDDNSFEKSKKIFSKNVLFARNRAKKRLLDNKANEKLCREQKS